MNTDSCCESPLRPAVTAPPNVPLGTIQSFGPVGPKYEAGPARRRLDDGDWRIEITLLETDEKTQYRWTHRVEDPLAV